MLTKSDIRLNNRLTKCSIIISSIPFTDPLVAHSELALNCGLADATICTQVDSGGTISMEIGSALNLSYGHPSGRLNSEISVSVDSLDFDKQCLLSIDTGMNVESSVTEFSKTSVDNFSNCVAIYPSLRNICNTRYVAGSTDLALGTSLFDFNPALSFDRGQSSLEMSSALSPTGVQSEKSVQVCSGIQPTVNLIEFVTQSFRLSAPITVGATLDIEAKTYRPVENLDGISLSVMDAATLEHLDYIIQGE